VGEYNSSFPRVQPVFEALLAKDPTGATWLPDLWRMASQTRDSELASPPAAFGALLPPGDIYERTIPPPTAPLRWAQIKATLSQAERLAGKSSGHDWWGFEGFTHADAYFETGECLLLVEGKQALSPSAHRFTKRNQLWRNVEAAQELARGRAFGVILALDSLSDGEHALREAMESLEGSYPHLNQPQRADLARHLLGYVVWRELVEHFGLPDSVLGESL
jgi:hypothetical protein